MFLPEWTQPSENINPPRSPFTGTHAFRGGWEGVVMDGSANMKTKLEILSSDSATLALGNKPAEISDMQTEGAAFAGKTVGIIESADAIRNEATMLALKLIPQNGKLIGRILATAKAPGTLLPYVLTLSKATS
jgi:hypothetical protein